MGEILKAVYELQLDGVDHRPRRRDRRRTQARLKASPSGLADTLKAMSRKAYPPGLQAWLSAT